MKKILLFALTLCILCSSLCACSKFVKQDEAVDASIIIRNYYRNVMPGINEKEITGQTAKSIADQLSALKKTGETEPKISNQQLSDYSFPEELKTGTVWIDVGNKTYRLPPEMDRICLTKTDLGEGEILEFPEQLRTEISGARYYWPHDYWSGTYRNGKLELQHRYEANTDITATVKNIAVENSDNPSNSITVEFVSKVTQELTVTLDVQSGCVLYEGDQKTLQLKAGKPQTETLTFGGTKAYFPMLIRAGNTVIDITVYPGT